MPGFQHSIQIDAPTAVAWRLLSQVDQWPRWLPTVSQVKPLGPGTVEPGARFVVHQPKLMPATWVVTDVVPPQSLVWEARSPGVRTRASHALTPLGPQRCALELHFAFSGWLGTPLGLLFARLTRAYLTQECAALKAAAERAASGNASGSPTGDRR